MSMTPYPVGLPTEAIMILIDKLRGSDVQTNDLILAAWNLAGYALNQITPSAEPRMSVLVANANADDVSAEEAIASLESLLPQSSNAEGGNAEGGNEKWRKILSIAIKIVIGLLLV